jgi:hypothetical protein
MPVRGNLTLCDFPWPGAVGGKAALMGIWGDILTPQLPTVLVGANLHWLGSWTDATVGQSFELAVTVVYPDGTRVQAAGISMVVADPAQTFSFTSPLPPIPVQHAGWLRFVVEHEGREVSSCDLPVRVAS